MKTHLLKIQSKYFSEVLQGKKNFELRKDDRDYEVGDLITLQEYDNGKYTGKEIKNIPIEYILRDCPEYGLKEGYCILGFNPFKSSTLKYQYPHPLCIVDDRYGGAYSEGRFLAFNMVAYAVQELPIDAGDMECCDFWAGIDKDYDVNDYVIGKGETPEEAARNLILLLEKERENNS